MKRLWGIEQPGDADVALDISRGSEIVEAIKTTGITAPRILEVACGSGRVSQRIKDLMPKAEVLATDICSYPEWDDLTIETKQMSTQDILDSDKRYYDFVVFLNSYRAWSGPDKEAFDEWMKIHALYFISSGIDGERIGMDAKENPMIMKHI